MRELTSISLGHFIIHNSGTVLNGHVAHRRHGRRPVTIWLQTHCGRCGKQQRCTQHLFSDPPAKCVAACRVVFYRTSASFGFFGSCVNVCDREHGRQLVNQRAVRGRCRHGGLSCVSKAWKVQLRGGTSLPSSCWFTTRWLSDAPHTCPQAWSHPSRVWRIGKFCAAPPPRNA